MKLPYPTTANNQPGTVMKHCQRHNTIRRLYLEITTQGGLQKADHQADHFNVSVNIKIGRIIGVKAEHNCTIFPFVMILSKEDLKRIVRFFSSIHKPQTFWTNKKREWFQFCWSVLCNIRAGVIIYQLDGVVRTAPIHKKGKNKSSWTKRWWWRDAQRKSQQTNKQH